MHIRKKYSRGSEKILLKYQHVKGLGVVGAFFANLSQVFDSVNPL